MIDGRVYDDKASCSGCSACYSICPKSAITMEKDEQGFPVPKVDEEKCIHCGLCEKVCPWKHAQARDEEAILKCYAAKHKDRGVIADSRSGGIFTALSDVILDSGGYVYGAALDGDFVTRHHRAASRQERDACRKSKYVQSELGSTFEAVRKDLQEGKQVLFSGTACQCSGLKAYLSGSGTNMDGLILCDIICAGVPSPGIVADYLAWLGKREKKSVTEFEFRDKAKYAWGNGVERVRFQNRKVRYQDYFTGSLFGDALVLRESCFHCPYTAVERLTDITLGDFWGIDKIYREFYDDKGCSLVLLHSHKGERLFQEAQKELLIKEIPRGQVERSQTHLYKPTEKPEQYQAFWEDYGRLSFDELIKKYAVNTVKKAPLLKRAVRKAVRVLSRRSHA